MKLYPLLQKMLFKLDPEKAHAIALQSLQCAYRTGLTRFFETMPRRERKVMGLSFPNPIGLAAGFDENGDYIDALATLGFGFIEIGTVTPKPQAGNPSPRLFRIPSLDALINRMGFNNKGVQYVATRLAKTRYRGILGINIGKNRDTPLEKALDDYRYGFQQLWRFASYMTINISSPNTPELRQLQKEYLLRDLLKALKNEQKLVFDQHQKYIPLVVKISPDMPTDELKTLANVLLKTHIDGVIATNTTIMREDTRNELHGNEVGGLSGRPLHTGSTRVIKQLYSIWQDTIPIIASGGVMDKASAQEKIAAGAALVQVYTGLIYKGPGLVKELLF